VQRGGEAAAGTLGAVQAAVMGAMQQRENEARARQNRDVDLEQGRADIAGAEGNGLARDVFDVIVGDDAAWAATMEAMRKKKAANEGPPCPKVPQPTGLPPARASKPPAKAAAADEPAGSGMESDDDDDGGQKRKASSKKGKKPSWLKRFVTRRSSTPDISMIQAADQLALTKKVKKSDKQGKLIFTLMK